VSELRSSPDAAQASEPVNELFQGPSPLVARGLVYLLLAMLLTALVYSFIGRINEIVTARATMAPRGLLRPVQATAAGRVARVVAREGEPVEQGQVVVYLETETAQAQLERARQELEIRRGQLQETLAGQADTLQVSEARARVAQAEADMVSAERALDAGMIVAPATGQLTQLHVRGVGEAVAPGQTVAEVAPGDAPLVFEAQVANSDIGRVRVGQSAILKVDAYPHQEYGTVDGRVVYIAPNALPTAGGGSAYRVTVVPVLAARPPGKKVVALRLGLAATVEIVADRRRIIDLLIRTIRGGE
jgi:multidrug resistance efflux pump